MKNLLNNGFCGNIPLNNCCNSYTSCDAQYRGCENEYIGAISNKGPKGDKGDNGRSAYEIAVTQGYVGTIEEWLNSLAGDSAYETAVKNGFVGTEAEWLESLKGEFDPGATLFEIITPNGTAPVGYGDTIAFSSDSMDILVDTTTGTISIESMPVGVDVQFHSNASDARLQSGVGGERAFTLLVGSGYESVANTGGVVTAIMPLHSQKVLKDSVVKEVYAMIRITLEQTDFPSTIYAQLFVSQNLLSAEFTPIAGTLMELGTFETGSPVGSSLMANIKNLNINIPAESQMMIGFYNITASGGLTAGTVGYLSGAVRLEDK